MITCQEYCNALNGEGESIVNDLEATICLECKSIFFIHSCYVSCWDRAKPIDRSVSCKVTPLLLLHWLSLDFWAQCKVLVITDKSHMWYGTGLHQTLSNQNWICPFGKNILGSTGKNSTFLEVRGTWKSQQGSGQLPYLTCGQLPYLTAPLCFI